ncbi:MULTISPECIES: helix-turn-helix domain-containing protein [unclassified Streptomyces]|uniref:helix-turn-helix domain-containing protein n=1 Tax=unclassified Streptomyces TaxID=2593676 RepID=UPI002E1470A3|nr:helix-turn-helix domain-containing protein [Streptomyces sp. NBC_01197]WSS53015.1 helix-turn-helix domain-containing protein [Streptomyces sp. NBC_01180]
MAGAVPASEPYSGDDIKDLLVVAEPGEPWLRHPRATDLRLSALAGAGATGLLVNGSVEAAAHASLTSAARRNAVPVVFVSGVPWLRAARVISDLRHDAAEVRAASLCDLLEAARPDTGGDANLLLDWLSTAVAGTAEILPPHEDATRMHAPDAVDALRAGRAAASGASSGSTEIRMYAIGASKPHPVLVVTRSVDFPPWAVAEVRRVLPFLERAVRHPLTGPEGLESAQVAVLQLLMGGLVTWARRTAHALRLSRTAMAASAVRVHILQCPPGLRDTAAGQCRQRLRETGLVVRCPVDDGQVIIIAAVSDSDREDDPARDALTALVAGAPDYRLGTSRPASLAATAGAYEEATQALAVARNRADRVAEYEEKADLTRLLPPAAHSWAERFLQPLARLPASRRPEIAHSVRLGLAFGVSGAAKLSGQHRNTVRAHLARTAQLLGLDLQRLGDRAVLSLALRIQDDMADDPAGDDGTAATADAGAGSEAVTGADAPGDDSLRELLRHPLCREWATRFLAPLDTARRPSLRRTVTTWVLRGARTEETAGQLQLHYKTVLAHLATAEKVLQRPLIETHRRITEGDDSANGFNGPHDVVLALHVTSPELGIIDGRLLDG